MKNFLKRIWKFIWDDDSFLSWIVNVIIAFILIKYVLYPGIGLLFGTTHPVVAVVSGSMEHFPNQGVICGVRPEKYNFDFDSFWEYCGSFYENYGITKEDFKKFPFKNGFNTGDIIVLFGRKPKDIKIGDVIVFRADQPDPIIHRVINKWEDNGKYYFTTKGDHNPSIILNYRINEQEIPEDRLIGKAYFKIPFLGYIKIWFVELLKLLKLDTTIGRLF